MKKFKAVAIWLFKIIVLTLVGISIPFEWVGSALWETRGDLYRSFRELGWAYRSVTKDLKEVK